MTSSCLHGNEFIGSPERKECFYYLYYCQLCNNNSVARNDSCSARNLSHVFTLNIEVELMKINGLLFFHQRNLYIVSPIHFIVLYTTCFGYLVAIFRCDFIPCYQECL
jgi:hypothetical protein